MNKKELIFRFSLFFNLIFIIAALFIFIKLGGISYVSAKFESETKYDENPHYNERMSLFKSIDIHENSIVFVGDSITQRGLWNELFPNELVINRGINSDTTDGVISRVSEIVASSPSKIFLMVGVNDIYRQKSTEKIIGNYSRILEEIKKSPNIDVYIQSVLPVNNELYGNGVNNDDVKKINEELVILANEFDYTYIDVYSTVENNNQLIEKYTNNDGIHLNGEGYNQWKNAIKEYVEN